MVDYSKVEAQLAAVRRAYKRRRALAGLAIVLVESLAVFTLFLLADWLYRPSPAVRVVFLLVTAAAVVVLVIRHILVHVFRRIPDARVALYVEEHRDDFQGALMTAAEFGRCQGLSPGQVRMIEASIDAATARASGLDLRSVVTLRRFRKYGWAAVILLAVYGGMGALFPQSVGHHVSRVLAPWRPTAEDLAAQAGPSARPFEEAMKLPITFALSKADARVPRGGVMDLEAVLSRPPDDPVVLQFRPAVEGPDAPWRDLPMKPVDKLNGFAAALQDVNEDLEFCVSSGPYRSEAHRVTVYSLLALAGMEIRTQFPAYLERPDRIDPSVTGDVAAPVGSVVTVRLVANNPLAAATLKWEGGPQRAMAIGDPKTAAAVSFEVTEDGIYGFTLRDADGQELASAVPSYVRALKDQPPTLDVKFPRIDIATHPLGQVSLLAEAADDWGVASAEFVYQVAAEGAPPAVRVPLRLKPLRGDSGGRSGAVAAAATFALEDMRPAVAPGTLITYHLEARDQKGQKAMSDIYMITVTPFEQWATWGMEFPEFGTHGGYLSSPLSVVLAAVWHVHTQKDTLPPAEFDRQAEDLARVMVDPSSGEVFPFIDFKKVPPDKMEHARRIPPLAKQAHGALLKHDTGRAVEFLRLGVAELALIGLSESPLLVAEGGGAMGGAPPPRPEAALAQLATFMLEAEAAGADMPLGQSQFEIIGPEYRRELRKIEEAEKLRKQVEDLKRGEQGIMDRAVALADRPAAPPDAPPAGDRQGAPPSGSEQGGQPSGPQPAGPSIEDPHGAQPPRGQESGGQEASPPSAGQPEAGGQASPPPSGGGDSAATLAQDQRGLAERTKAAAMDARAAAETDVAFGRMADRMDQAARDMFVASAKMAQGGVQDAIADVRRAQDNLLEAAKSIQGLQRHGLEQALDLAQAHAERVLRDQREARAATETLASQLGGGRPDAGQQRDLGRLAYRQGEIRSGAEQLQQEVGVLRRIVERGARPDTTRSVEEANRGAVRHQVVQKMTNAAIELEGGRPGGAAPEQAKAEAGLAAVLDSLREAAGTLAADYKSELARAKFEADRAASALERLGGKEGEPQAGQDAQADSPPGPAPLGPRERQDLSQQAASDLARLGRHLENRRLVPEEAERIRQAADDPDRLAKVLAAEEAKREELLGVVRKVGSKLVAELQAKLEAERLKDFQREECPPQYRPLVNKYYELLSQTRVE